MGKVGVEDNSVAAVVSTKLLCSLTDEQIAKTVQEVKRVLIPVSIMSNVEVLTLSTRPQLFKSWIALSTG